MSEPNKLDPTPELPDDTPISDIELPVRIRNVLAAAGLETVGEVRETSDEILLSFQVSERSLSPIFVRPWACRRPTGSGRRIKSPSDLLIENRVSGPEFAA
jgi:Bacterial RNA polymerase, alpha chain C terminal domain